MNANNVVLIEAVKSSMGFTQEQSFSPEYVKPVGILMFHLLLGSSFIFGKFSEVPLRVGSEVAHLNLLPSHTIIGWIVVVSVYAFILVVVWKKLFKKNLL